MVSCLMVAAGGLARCSTAARDPNGRPRSEPEEALVTEPGTAVLAYSIEGEEVRLQARAEGRVGTYLLPVRAGDLELLVRTFRLRAPEAVPGSRYGESSLEHLRDLGRYLFEVLVEPASGILDGAGRLLVVPDGVLGGLPFGALVRPVAPIPGAVDGSRLPGRDADGRWQYLAEWKPIHVASSARGYRELVTRRPVRRSTEPMRIAAFGDPGRSGFETASASAAAPRPRGRTLLTRRPLPFTRREVEALASLYASEDVRIFLGDQATEERVLAVGPGSRILHFATHGYLDPLSPLDSALALATPRRLPWECPTRWGLPLRCDGLLRVREILDRLHLDADLVVLSACQTAVGQGPDADERFGLARAFQEAGARTVVGSLWSVDDQATAELMTRFYRHLRQGETKDAALRSAQLALLRGPIESSDEDGRAMLLDASAPYYWAPFQVYGDWR